MQVSLQSLRRAKILFFFNGEDGQTGCPEEFPQWKYHHVLEKIHYSLPKFTPVKWFRHLLSSKQAPPLFMFPAYDCNLGWAAADQQVRHLRLPNTSKPEFWSNSLYLSLHYVLLLHPWPCLARPLAYPGDNVDGDLGWIRTEVKRTLVLEVHIHMLLRTKYTKDYRDLKKKERKEKERKSMHEVGALKNWHLLCHGLAL